MLLTLGAGLTGCRPSGGASEATPADGIPPIPGKPIRGTVIEVLADRSAVLLDHEAVPGALAPGRNEFRVEAAELAALSNGIRITARLVDDPELGRRLEGIWREDLAGDASLKRGADELREETRALGREAYRDLGDTIPAFVMVDQDERVVQARNLRGKWLVVNFIFTRCQVAEMCPASTAKMVRLQRELKAAGVTNAHLISITLDPAYDSPAVLRDYAMTRGVDTSNFSLLTGPAEAVADLLRQFGILIAPSDNVIKHTQSTLLVSPDGRIEYREDGARWLVESYFERLKAAAAVTVP
jgi:protein SCO1